MFDIPDSGAVFIIGDAYLKNNQENYFFIKNDPVVNIYANNFGQNGVICESGRFFVWGHNEYHQLGVGAKEVITKPTLTKFFRDNGMKIKDVAFGYQFTVVLTEDNKIYYAGRIIFPPGSRIYSLKGRSQHHADTTEFLDSYYELSEFEYFAELEYQDFYRIHAGGNHFVVQTKCGRLIGFGQNGGNQLGYIDVSRLNKEPVLLSLQNVQYVVCGNEYTLAVTENNEIFVTGKFNSTQSTNFTKLNTSSLDSKIANIHVSIIEEICIITERHEIYISKSRSKLEDFAFYKLKLLENCDKIMKLESGSNFLAFTTNTERFFTNYRENVALGDYPEFHELDKFKNFRITTFTCGLSYILLKGVPKLDAFGLNENRLHNPLLSFTEDYGDGLSEASTESPSDHVAQQKPGGISTRATVITSLHDTGIKFIENGIERHDNSHFLGQQLDRRIDAKEETRRIMMEESTPIRTLKHSPKVRIKTPMPRESFADSFSASDSTSESDHSVDEDLNRKIVKRETRIGQFFRRLKERALEFEEGCKETKNVIEDSEEVKQSKPKGTNSTKSIDNHLPNTVVCSIQ